MEVGVLQAGIQGSEGDFQSQDGIQWERNKGGMHELVSAAW